MLSISSSRLIVLPTLSFTFLVSLPMESKNTVPFIYFFICSGGVCLTVYFLFFKSDKQQQTLTIPCDGSE